MILFASAMLCGCQHLSIPPQSVTIDQVSKSYNLPKGVSWTTEIQDNAMRLLLRKLVTTRTTDCRDYGLEPALLGFKSPPDGMPLDSLRCLPKSDPLSGIVISVWLERHINPEARSDTKVEFGREWCINAPFEISNYLVDLPSEYADSNVIDFEAQNVRIVVSPRVISRKLSCTDSVTIIHWGAK